MKNFTQSTGVVPTNAQPSLTQLLPSTGRAFSAYLMGLLAFCGCLTLYILLSVQILGAEDVLYRKEAAYHEINQQNADIIWRISQASNLARVEQRAKELDYTSAESHHYVQAATLPVITQQVAALPPITWQPVTLQPTSLPQTTLAMKIQMWIEAAGRYFIRWQQDTDYQAHQS